VTGWSKLQTAGESAGTYNTHKRDDKCMQNFSRENWREETTWKTYA